MDHPFTRRHLLRAVTAAAAVSLAGCNGESSPDEKTSTETGTEVHTTTAGAGENPTTTPGSETTATGTATPDPQVVVTGLDADPSTTRQGDRVTLTVTLETRGDTGSPHPLRLHGEEDVLRRTRVPTDEETLSTTFDVRCDRPGTRTFAADNRETSVTVEPWPQAFLEVDDTDFVLDGEPVHLVGTNNAYLHHKSHKSVDEVLRDAAAIGLDTVRILVSGGGTEVGYCRDIGCNQEQYGLQPAPREYDEASFRRLDYVVAAAKRHGLRVVPSLITRAPGGIAAYVDWVDGADDPMHFYTNAECRAIYRDYLREVLTRENTITGVEYRNDPTIAIWELANEPETEGQPFAPELQDWIAEMAAHAKSIDPNHLLSVGLIGWNDPGNEADYLACFESDAVDAASTHMYYDADGIDDWVQRHATGVHDELGKPLYVGEFGWDATRTDPDYQQQLANRHEAFRDWYDQFARHGVAGSLFWFLLGHLDEGARFPDHDGFGVYYPEDEETATIVAGAAERSGGSPDE